MFCGILQSSRKGVNRLEVVPGADTHELGEGPVTIAGYHIEVIHTPGHCAGSCMYLFAEDGFLIVGDMVLCNEFGTTFRPTGSALELKASVAKVWARGFADDLPCYCGHRDNTTFGKLRQLLETYK